MSATYREIKHADLIRYGMIREAASRFAIITQTRPLGAADLYNIMMKAENGALAQYKRIFAAFGHQLRLSDKILRQLAEEAYAENVGARGIKTVLDRHLKTRLYEAMLHDTLRQKETQKNKSIRDIREEGL